MSEPTNPYFANDPKWCEASPSGRHAAGTNGTDKTESDCLHCAATIYRAHSRSPSWSTAKLTAPK